MPKATLTRPSGTTIVIEGSSDEIEDVIKRVEQIHTTSQKPCDESRKIATKAKPKGTKGRILDLRNTGFFKSKQTLTNIKKELEVEGHFVAQNVLSARMLELVKAKELRRLKEGDTWQYVQR